MIAYHFLGGLLSNGFLQIAVAAFFLWLVANMPVTAFAFVGIHVDTALANGFGAEFGLLFGEENFAVNLTSRTQIRSAA
jgi:hypothetical protein